MYRIEVTYEKYNTIDGGFYFCRLQPTADTADDIYPWVSASGDTEQEAVDACFARALKLSQDIIDAMQDIRDGNYKAPVNV